MNDQELKQVLARIAVADKRQVDVATLAHWRETIGDLKYANAMEAISIHFRESTEYLMAAHVRRIDARIREQRALERGEYEDDAPIGSGAPQPDNLDDMVKAAGDDAEFTRQCAIYNRQLITAGFPIDERYPVAEAA